MPEELGKIEKPSVASFKAGRKLFFVPLVFSNKDLPLEFVLKYNAYWEQVESQIANLESRLGPAKHIYHELIPDGGEAGLKALEDLNVSSISLIRSRIEKGSIFEALENNDILMELMDWSRCLAMGLQSQKVYSAVYNNYSETNQKRNEYAANKINETLKENESGIVVMGEGHHVQFPSDIQVFYIAPPALDELKRWLRDYEAKLKEKPAEPPSKEPPVQP